MMMLVDCQTCPVREVRCADCVVTALGGGPVRHGRHLSSEPAAEATGLPLDRAERRAVSALLAAGLVTPEVAHAARAQRDPSPPLARPRHRRAAG
ncbi:hypothetical protein [Intrasporangium chromatireducens]|nr:hypothetical protein [Intrasporangium chromatireducens]